MDNLLKAIYSKFSTSAFSTDVGGRIYLDEAPPKCEFPYCVYFIVSGNPDNVFAKNGEDILIQFSLFSSSESATEITDMYKDLTDLFDDCSLTIPPIGDATDNLVWMKRVNLTTSKDEITTAAGTFGLKAWHVDYQILTQKI